MILSGITFSDDLLLENEFDNDEIFITVEYTLGGSAVIDSLPLSGGRTYTIAARSTGSGYSGFVTRAQAKQLEEIKRAGGTVVFEYEGTVMQVKIASLKLRPVNPRPNQADDEDYTGTITLIEV